MPKNVISIKESNDTSYIRSNFGLYTGGDKSSISLLKFLIRNSGEEFSKNRLYNRIAITVDTKEKFFSVMDNGTGFPFNEKETISKDFLTELIGKSIDKLRPHINFSVLTALSSKIIINSVKENIHAIYNIEDGKISRTTISIDKKPFSTKIICYPNSRLFSSFIDKKSLVDYLTVMKNQNNMLMLALIFDGEKIIIGSKGKIKRRKRTRKLKENDEPKEIPVKVDSIPDDWSLSKKPFTERIYVDHMYEKVQSVGNICHVFGRNDSELEKRSKMISSLPEMLKYLTDSVSYLEDGLKTLKEGSKEYKKLNKLIINIKSIVIRIK